MTSSPRDVFDANVILSAAIIGTSTSRRAFDVAREHGTRLLSGSLDEELEDVFARRKFERYLSLATRAEFLSTFKSEATNVECTVAITACRDPEDDHILERAVSGDGRLHRLG